MSTKIAVFDWNCTLINDFKFINEATNMLLYYFGYNNHVSFKEHRNRRPLGIFNVLTNSQMPEAFIKENEGLIIQKFHDYLSILSQHSRLRYGAKQILDWTKNNEYTNFIVSNHHIYDIYPHIERLNIPIEKEFIFSNGAYYNKTPKEQLFLKAIKDREIDFSSSFMVGDSLEELEIANKYGMKAFWISGGDYHYRHVKKEKPIKISNLTNIIEVLKHEQ